VSFINPITGKRWNGQARTLAWYLIHGQWPNPLKATCTTHACWNPYHAQVPRLGAQQIAFDLIPDGVLLAEVERRGLLPRDP
jgi:hypothetical protein